MNRLEELRVQQMMRLGCCACAWIEIVYIEIVYIAEECHHLLEGNRRMGHWFTIGLCGGHHRGVWTPEQRIAIPAPKLIAISDGRKTFTRIYPTEHELWDRTQERLGLAWPTSKVLPRRVVA